jgi:AcrR family transcriptional regulator
MSPQAARTRRKKRDQYHHGDLRRALLDEALRTVRRDGIEALTLRAIGQSLGVSRTALYRHFADKRALLTVVATEGFRLLRERLIEAWESAGGGTRGFNQMGMTYIRFAIANPSHYRVMFGRPVDQEGPRDEALNREAAGAFQALVASLVALQKDGSARKEDPLQLARFIWAGVHGISMLIIDGQLRHDEAQVETLIQFSVEHLHTGIAAPASRPPRA